MTKKDITEKVNEELDQATRLWLFKEKVNPSQWHNKKKRKHMQDKDRLRTQILTLKWVKDMLDA